ncbi:MAG: SCO family protein [Opitutaceae bacterium]|nr:SCO family protein [Opitutaceae bacterium]
MSNLVRFRRAFLPLFIVAIVVIAGGYGCSKPKSTPRKEERGHLLLGQVISIYEERSTLLVKHEANEGYMAAMTMELSVSRGDLGAVSEGMFIRARLVELEEGGFGLENIWLDDSEAYRIINKVNGELHKDTASRGQKVYRGIGEAIPNFALYNQDNEVVQPSQFLGKPMVVNFIYTRCPDATMCPASMVKMIQIQREASELNISDLELISITLDPEYDTPGVLHEYAVARGIDTTNFSFLTGPEYAISDLMKQLGLLSFPEEEFFRHSLSTLLISREGKIVYREEGSKWKPENFVKKLKEDSLEVE